MVDLGKRQFLKQGLSGMMRLMAVPVLPERMAAGFMFLTVK